MRPNILALLTGCSVTDPSEDILTVVNQTPAHLVVFAFFPDHRVSPGGVAAFTQFRLIPAVESPALAVAVSACAHR